jgi:hypothetical protein
MKTKITLFVAVIAVALFGVGCASTQPAFVSDGLVAYYPFNGNAEDESGNGNDGEVNGKVSFGIDRHDSPLKTGVFGAGHITVDKPKGLSPINTISCWVLVPIYENRNGYIVNLGVEANDNNNWLEIVDGKYIKAGSTTSQHFDTKWIIPEGNWFNVVTTYNGKSRSLYINGVIDEITREMGGRDPIGLYVGGSDRYAVKGSIDDVRIYNRALSAEEVKALYDLEKPKGK